MGKTVKYYQTPDGKKPFGEWMTTMKIKNRKAFLRIIDRLTRIMKSGSYGDHKHLGEGVHEMRFFLGPGYRVYYAEDRDVLVILLCGGDKSSQQQDILKAKAYWREYRERYQ